MKKIDINCDVGEGIGNEALIMPFINSCNIACNAHAGSIQIMEDVVDLAIDNQVKIGAHPSYPDRENFGRLSMKLSESEFQETIIDQIELLKNILLLKGAKLNHIKPHGALYNDVSEDKVLAKKFLKIISKYKNDIKLFVPFNSEIEVEAKRQGFKIINEGFADRNYNDDLSLVSRSQQGAVLNNISEIINHISEMFLENKVTTVSGNKIYFKADTFCVHSDTKNAIDIIKSINNCLTKL